jgi:hypothetical protein
VDINEGKVTFRWKNYRKGPQNQLLTLEAAEFIGRFMRHILPFGFYKIRYYGLLASANGAKRQQCILLIAKQPQVALLQGLSVHQVLKMVIGKDPDKCPKCKKGKMVRVALLHSG